MKKLELKDLEKFPQLITEEYQYRNFKFQRKTSNCMWYVIYCNEIVNWGQYRNDLEEWVDIQYKNSGLTEMKEELELIIKVDDLVKDSEWYYQSYKVFDIDSADRMIMEMKEGVIQLIKELS